MEGGLLKIGETARIIGVSIETIRNWTDKGIFPCIITPTKHRLYRRSEIELFLKNGLSK